MPIPQRQPEPPFLVLMAGNVVDFHNRAICSHAGFCTDGLREVFREEGTPWIDADGEIYAVNLVFVESRTPFFH